MHGTNSTSKRTLRAVVLAALTALPLGLSIVGGGCGDAASAVCVARCDCQGCSQKERDDCADDIDDAKRLADFDACGDAFSSYAACYEGEGTCSEGVWVTSTCTDLGRAMQSCSRRASLWVRTACQEERDKFEACGSFGGGSSDCTGITECVALCALGASCGELVDPQSGTTYVNCVNTCQSGGFGP